MGLITIFDNAIKNFIKYNKDFEISILYSNLDILGYEILKNQISICYFFPDKNRVFVKTKNDDFSIFYEKDKEKMEEKISEIVFKYMERED